MQFKSILGMVAVVAALVTLPGAGKAQSFAAHFDGPVKLSVFQPLPGFEDALRKMDQDTGLFAPSDQWHPFWNGDVWVYFLSEESDLNFLGGLGQEIFVRQAKTPNPVAISRTEVGFQNGRRVLVQYVFMKLMGSDLEAAACRAAASVYAGVSGASNAESDALVKTCGD